MKQLASLSGRYTVSMGEDVRWPPSRPWTGILGELNIMTTINVSNSTDLVAALTSAVAGETIALAPGVYSPMALYNLVVPAGVTVTSAIPGDPAVLTGVTANHCTGLNFTGLTFSTASTPIGPYGPSTTWSFQFDNCTGLHLSKLAVVGTPGVTLANATSGIKVEKCYSTYIAFNTFSWLHYGIEHDGDSGLAIIGNSFSYLYDDAIRGGGSSYVRVLNNAMTSMHMDPTDTDHPDCCQFWTIAGTTATNITVSGNTYVRGDGNPIQGVFFEDSIGGLAFNNVTINDNSITGGGYNGITVMGAGDSVNNLTMDNNTVTSYADITSFITIYDVDGGVVSGDSAIDIKTYNDIGVTYTDDTNLYPVSAGSAAASIAAGRANSGPARPTGADTIATAAFASHIAAMAPFPLSLAMMADARWNDANGPLARLAHA
jgi:hypothetical protein